jgi:uncharacterized membrane protein HdeD (DUF308 family)
MAEGTPWVWVVVSGGLSVLVGGMILAQWPVSSLFALGIILGVDLVDAGAGWIGMGLALRGQPEAASPRTAPPPRPS